MVPTGFVGRLAELDRLDAFLRRVTDGRRDLPGVAVLLRGRRRVGKSRLVNVFCERSGVPYVFFQCSRRANPDTERIAFAAAVAESRLPDRELFTEGIQFPSWASVFRQLNAVLPDDGPSVVVIDELPWLVESDPTFEGVLQTAWDTLLSRKPVLLILIGSDLAMMEQFDAYDRPFHQRGSVMVLPPLNPGEVAEMLALEDADAIDAHLVTGGLPLVCQDWEPGQSIQDFLRTSLSDPTSALLVSGERSLAGEFPAHLQAQTVLAAIGNGERTWSGIRAKVAVGPEPMAASSLTNALRQLEYKRVIAIDTPLSTRPADRERRYRVADPYLRFFLAFLFDGLPLVDRGRGDLLLRRIERSWATWRGRAVEPLVRDALLRLAPDLGWPETEAVGGWWNRQNNPEVDIVGADREKSPTRVLFVGSIKWREERSFGGSDYNTLVRDVERIPGADDGTELIAVSRHTTTDGPGLRILGPEDLVNAWRRAPGGA